MSDTDLIKLYSGRILALAANMPHTARLTAPQATARKRSPMCGSMVTVDLAMQDGRISEYGQDVKACALGKAAASVVGAGIIGRTIDEVSAARAQLVEMLRNEGPTPDAPFNELEVLLPAREYKNRHASILLAFDAALEAAEQIALSETGGSHLTAP